MTVAHDRGREAGRHFILPSRCPYPDGTSTAAQWEISWRRASEEVLLERDMERRRRRGTIAAEACSELGT